MSLLFSKICFHWLVSVTVFSMHFHHLPNQSEVSEVIVNNKTGNRHLSADQTLYLWNISRGRAAF